MDPTRIPRRKMDTRALEISSPQGWMVLGSGTLEQKIDFINSFVIKCLLRVWLKKSKVKFGPQIDSYEVTIDL